MLASPGILDSRPFWSGECWGLIWCESIVVVVEVKETMSHEYSDFQCTMKNEKEPVPRELPRFDYYNSSTRKCVTAY